MSLETYIRALPKCELNIHLEGALLPATIARIADQNEIAETMKNFTQVLASYTKPDLQRLFDITKTINSWVRHADEIARLVYDVGTSLHKQNVVYTEISVNPTLYMHMGITLDALLAMLEDGRDRAMRAWGIQIAWVFIVPRDEPRRADDIARWVTTASAKNGHVVAIGLSGREDSQPAGQFERAFKIAERRDVPRVVRAGDYEGAAGIDAAVELLTPSRLIDARGLTDNADVLQRVADRLIAVSICPARARRHGWVTNYADLPLQALIDAGVLLTLGSDMPSLYGATLNDAYLTAATDCGLSMDAIDGLALNGIQASFMPDELKTALFADMRQQIERLRLEHLSETHDPQ